MTQNRTKMILMLLLILSTICATFSCILSYHTGFKIGFHGFGNPGPELSTTSLLVLGCMWFIPCCIMIVIYIINIIQLYRGKAPVKSYIIITFISLSIIAVSFIIINLLLYCSPVQDMYNTICTKIASYILDHGGVYYPAPCIFLS